jgi:hypothetical protein
MNRPVPPDMPDADRDAWLSEALRHAPDADMAPPASLSEMILREAQAKAKPAAPAPRPPMPWWTRLWVWSAKPAVGAGLASVMVASLVGVMMWDRPLQDSSPRSRMDLPVPAAAPAPVPPPPSGVAPPQEQAAAAGIASTAADQAAAQAPAPAKPLAQDKRPPEVVAEAKKKQATLEDEKRKQPELTAEPERRSEQSVRAFAAKEERQREVALKAEPDALSKAARTAEAMSPAAPAVSVSPKVVAPQPAITPAPVPPPPAIAMPAPAAPAAAPTPSPTPSADAATTAPMAAQSTGTTTPGASARMAKPGVSNLAAGERSIITRLPEDTEAFAALRAALAAEPAPWRWQRDAGALHVVDDTLGAFLAQVDAAAHAGWAPTTAIIMSSHVAAVESQRAKADVAADASTADRPGVRTVRLLRDGKPAHVLRQAGRSLYWDRDEADAARRTVRVIQLDERQLQSVRAAFDRLTP